MTVTASTAEGLSAAPAADAQHLVVCGRLTGLPTITLSPGVSRSGAEAAELVFDDGTDGSDRPTTTTLPAMRYH